MKEEAGGSGSGRKRVRLGKLHKLRGPYVSVFILSGG